MLKSPNINSFVDVKTVLATVGIEPSEGLTARESKCPVCGRNQFRIASDPMASGGCRFRCTYCHINKDGIQLVGAVKGIGTKEAIAEIRRRSSSLMPKQATGLWYAGYTKTERTIQLLMELYNTGCIRICTSANASWISALSHLGVWLTRDERLLSATIGKTFAGIERRDLEILLGTKIVFGSYKAKFLVMVPLCDVFNRPRSLYLMNGKGEDCIYVLEEFENDVRSGSGRLAETGLAFLDDIKPQEEVVFAIQGVRYAAFLRCKHYFESKQRQPLVGWEPSTSDIPWKSISPRKVILWSPYVSPDTFNQIYGDRVYVATSPSFDHEPTHAEVYELLTGFLAKGWLARLQQEAKPWSEALANWLLSLPEEEAAGAVVQLDLHGETLISVINAAPDKAASKKIADLFGYDEIPARVQVDGMIIEQTGAMWYEIINDSPIMILDCVPYFDSIHTTSSGRFITGTVQRGNAYFPFRAPLDLVAADFPRWLENFLIDNKQPPPRFSPKWRMGKYSRALFTVAQMFHNPETKDVLEQVKWTPGLGYLFPTFRLQDGEIRTDDLMDVPRIADYVPGEAMAAPDLAFSPRDDMFAPTPANAVAWAMAGAILTNLLSTEVGRELRGIVVLSGSDDAGIVAARGFAETMDLPFRDYVDFHQLQTMDAGHAIPLIVDARRAKAPELRNYVAQPEEKSLLVIVSDLEGWRDMSLAGWIGVNGIKAPEELDYRAITNCMFKVLQHAAGKDPPGSADNTLDLNIDVFGKRARQLVKAAKSCLFGELHFRTTAAARALIPYIYRMSVNSPKRLETDGAAFCIPVVRISGLLRSMGISNMLKATLFNRMADAGWVVCGDTASISVPSGVWEQTVAVWRQLQPTDNMF